jgi:RNA polymerase sigma-54 factor
MHVRNGVPHEARSFATRFAASGADAAAAAIHPAAAAVHAGAGQEVEQMLDDNPFLERTAEEAPREEFGLEQPTPRCARPTTAVPNALLQELHSASIHGRLKAKMMLRCRPSASADEPDWERRRHAWRWRPTTASGAATPRAQPQRLRGRRGRCATELARSAGVIAVLPAPPGAGAAPVREDRAALRFLIESLNDDGYLEDSLKSWPLPGRATTWSRSTSWCTASPWPCACCRHLEPVGVGARNLAECLTLQLRALAADAHSACRRYRAQTALRICQQPLELLARRDVAA